MGSRGNTSRVNGIVTNKLKDYDARFGKGISDVAKKIHDEFPEVYEITTIIVDPHKEGGIASVNGVGMLHIDENLLRDYEQTQRFIQSLCDSGYSAGANLETGIWAHELAHNLDIQMQQVFSYHAPMEYDKPITIRNEKWKEGYSRALGRNVEVGEVVTDIPGVSITKKFLEVDGKQYSYGDFMGKKVSDIIVPLAIQNIQNNWQKLGFKVKPTEAQLINNLSGYVYIRHYDDYGMGGDTKTEILAESYADSIAHGKNANVLSQEVMRLTKAFYKSAVSNPDNGVKGFYERLFSKKKEDKDEWS